MEYRITVFKKQGEPLYALWIDTPDVEPQPGSVWQEIQAFEFKTERPISTVLCGLLLMSEATSDRLFRQIADTWIVADNDNSLNNYHAVASREEVQGSLNRIYFEDPSE